MSNQDNKNIGFHILIIDDDQRLRALLRKFLENKIIHHNNCNTVENH